MPGSGPLSSQNQKSLLTFDKPRFRRINLANTTPDKLEKFIGFTSPSSFGIKQEKFLDETYCKAGEMDRGCFSQIHFFFETEILPKIKDDLLDGTKAAQNTSILLHKLNVYGMKLILFTNHLHSILCCYLGKGSFFKPHVDVSRSNMMFGTLVIVLPTPHKGGALLLRHRGQEWAFDSGEALAAKDQPSIGYVAYFSDVEHEVAPVISGHRITYTYSLYFPDDRYSRLSVWQHPTPPEPANHRAFREAFTALLKNPEFMADGGTLAFGLRYSYPIKDGLLHVASVLKGSDMAVYQSASALGYTPTVYVYYQDQDRHTGAIIQRVVDFPKEQYQEDIVSFVCGKGGFPVIRKDPVERDWDDTRFGTPEELEWVTPVTVFNRQRDAVLYYVDSDAETSRLEYGNVCLVVRVGKAGERLAYPAVWELERARYIREHPNWEDELRWDEL